ncbi:MAG: AglZ/HisF2 family acetamidino modification protein [Bacteroidota bacterium]
MFRPRVIPILLLKGQGIVKTVKFDKCRYIGDPINAVRIFNDLEVDELVFLDILASKENRTISVDIVKQIGDEAFMPFAVGGGIKTTKDAIALIHAGAEKIILNTYFVKNPKLVTELANLIGNQSVVVSIDVKKKWLGTYQTFICGGIEKVSETPIDLAHKAEQLGAGEIIINSITHDGMMEGYDLELIRQITSAVNIPVIACGGAGKLHHLREATDNGAHAVAAGSLFVYHGARNAVLINYPEKKELINNFS